MFEKLNLKSPWFVRLFGTFLQKNLISLNVDIVKYSQKQDTKTIVMEETNRQSLYVCSATLLSGIADLKWNQLFLISCPIGGIT